MNVTDLSVAQLHQILAIKEQIENLQTQLESIADVGREVPTPLLPQLPLQPKRKYHLSPAHRRKLIIALAKARAMRWGKGKPESKPAKKDRRSSPATRAKLAAAARARWAKVKAEGKKGL